MTRDPIKVEDKRHWAREKGDAEDAAELAPGARGEAVETIDAAELETMRARAEAAERKLREVQETFLAARSDLERTRDRLERDLDRKVALRFGDLVAGLVESVDDLDRAVEAGAAVPGAAPVVSGVVLDRDRFLAALVREGVTRIDPTGQPYDPNVAEAVGVAPVSDPAKVSTVVQVLRAGYAIGERVVRPARVVVGRLVE